LEGHIGKYTIVEELGRGAMGIVYKAVDPLIDRTVAVKTIRFDMYSQPEQRVEAQKRFLREAKSAGNITHPNIVTIYDMGEDNGTFYIAMEYVEGQSLETLLAQKKRWTLQETIRLVVEIADGLDSTHKKGIIHRDIKPGNILVDKEGQPHIVDFGIARVPTSNLTQTSAVMGTPYYMAPEQVAARKIDHRVDVFALGAIFYEMLTLEKPFPGENLTTVIYKIMNEPPHPLREFKTDVPNGLEPIIQKVLAKDPDARYQSCRELINDLLSYADTNGMVIGDRFRARSPLSETAKMAKPALKAQPAGGKKPLPMIIGGAAVIVLLAVGAVLLTRKGGTIPPAGPETKEVSGQVAGPSSKPADKTKPVTVTPDDGKTTAEPPKVKETPKPVTVTPDNGKTTSEPPKVKETPKPPVEPADTAAAEAALKNGDLKAAQESAQKALLAFPGSERAKAVLAGVAVQTAPAEVGSMLNDYVVSLKAGKLLPFYQTRSTPALYEKLRKNLDTMAKYYSEMEGTAGKPVYETASAKYPNYAIKARFPHTITALPKGKKKRETVFEGTYIWRLEKAGPRWILIDLVFEAKS
jgi:tRNA A-37 threonylcarbamoyl transferase component Bud32